MGNLLSHGVLANHEADAKAFQAAYSKIEGFLKGHLPSKQPMFDRKPLRIDYLYSSSPQYHIDGAISVVLRLVVLVSARPSDAERLEATIALCYLTMIRVHEIMLATPATDNNRNALFDVIRRSDGLLPAMADGYVPHHVQFSDEQTQGLAKLRARLAAVARETKLASLAARAPPVVAPWQAPSHLVAGQEMTATPVSLILGKAFFLGMQQNFDAPGLAVCCESFTGAQESQRYFQCQHLVPGFIGQPELMPTAADIEAVKKLLVLSPLGANEGTGSSGETNEAPMAAAAVRPADTARSPIGSLLTPPPNLTWSDEVRPTLVPISVAFFQIMGYHHRQNPQFPLIQIHRSRDIHAAFKLLLNAASVERLFEWLPGLKASFSASSRFRPTGGKQNADAKARWLHHAKLCNPIRKALAVDRMILSMKLRKGATLQPLTFDVRRNILEFLFESVGPKNFLQSFRWPAMAEGKIVTEAHQSACVEKEDSSSADDNNNDNADNENADNGN